MSDGETVGVRKVAEWQALRELVKEAEAAEHPDLIDAHGRRWTWWAGGDGDLYRHEAEEACDGVCPPKARHPFAWPLAFLPEPVTEALPRDRGVA